MPKTKRAKPIHKELFDEGAKPKCAMSNKKGEDPGHVMPKTNSKDSEHKKLCKNEVLPMMT